MFRLLAACLWACARMVVAAGPNVVLIMTDDQDMLLDSLSVMPNVMNLIAANGTLYNKHYCTVAWCCPSRVNLLTGMTAHNTNVTALSPPYGGWPKFIKEGLNDRYLPVWINATGAHTYYLGKFMNAYGNKNFNKPFPNGWTNMSMLVDPSTYNYYHGRWTNGYTDQTTKYDNIHTTDVTQTKALEYLDVAASTNNQFFMMIAPVAPHDQIVGFTHISKPPPPDEFKDAFTDQVAPRTPNFNPETPSGASWVANLPRLNNDTVTENDAFHVARLQNLAGVDLMVAAIIQKLEDLSILDNTYVMFTSDNGFHIGNHRMMPGKRCGYEEDINIPLLIRGPGVPANFTSGHTQSHTDIAPTVLTMMGIPLQEQFDGSPIPMTQAQLTNTTNTTELVNVEFWDSPGIKPFDPNADGDVSYAAGHYYNNTYKSLRIQSGGESFYYSVWCSGEHELYDMNTDSYQMNNLMSTIKGPLANLTGAADVSTLYFGRPINQLIARLDALLMVTKSCKGVSCRNPYSALFPKNEVYNLTGAMEDKYDRFFASQPTVAFSVCFSGSLTMFEGPMEVRQYSGAAPRTLLARLGYMLWVGVWLTYYVVLA